MSTIKVISLNTSSEKGTIKQPIPKATINFKGMDGDAHSGHWHRQISMLAIESYRKMEAKKEGTKLDLGVFAENITTEGIELHKTNIFDRFVHKDVVLEVTQIGKKCHQGCDIMKQIGDCVMPVEGIFCQVIKEGELKPGDTFEYQPRVIKTLVITLSDRAFKGIYEDKSGPFAEKMMTGFFENTGRHFTIDNKILPDDEAMIQEALKKAKDDKYDIIITTGGTGLAKRDITPDVVKPMLDKEIPGIMEHIRVKYGSEKPNALISRSIAGVMGSTLVYVLPGSPKAVNEYLNEIIPTIEHSLRMIHGVDFH
ncbi:MOSC domain-containing protein [Labilibacter marinus]|uniref:MOSC domain-containing protein n=1 Tax=Labilibacter marinus TaxID=1477105 RepID=UPI00094F86B0|nr:MOSC domain-containing protein [Labilibacter marinus]